MKLWTELGTGITLNIGEHERERLVPSSMANQKAPKRSYVYGHYDEHGTPFYIGMGTDRRAWVNSRHPYWHRYVERHLGGKYTVKILADDLTPEEAESLESEWVAQESKTLVNVVNFGRKTDFAELERYHALRDANRVLIAGARSLESTQPETAIATYRRAIENIDAYATMKTESGLIGQLIDEERAEVGISGGLAALNRLTLCLVKLGRQHEAQEATERYFEKYRFDATTKSAEPIKKRLSKGTRRGTKPPGG